MPDHEVTVAIPLHRGARWADNVIANARRLRGHARILISDADERDDALARVRDALPPGPDVEFAGARDLPAGWTAHFEDLRRRAGTPLMMWLPQDDEIDARWVTGAAAALAAAPRAVLAIGAMTAVHGEGLQRAGLLQRPSPRLEHHDPIQRVRAAAEFIFTDWGPVGLAVHGVFRRSTAPALPDVPPDGRMADALWVLGAAARGPFASIPHAAYRKRFYAGSTHQRWGHPGRGDMLLPHMEAMLRRCAPRGREADYVAAGWHGDRMGVLATLLSTEQALGDVLRAHDALAGEVARAARVVEAAGGHARDLERALDAARAAEAAARTARDDAHRDAERARRDAEATRDDARRNADRAAAAERLLAALTGSRSWRLTAPLRAVAATARRRVARPR